MYFYMYIYIFALIYYLDIYLYMCICMYAYVRDMCVALVLPTLFDHRLSFKVGLSFQK